MISSKDRAQLQQLLDRAVDQDEAFTIDELRGFLYGLAITPEPIMPSEWMPVVFGDEMIEVDSENEAQALFNDLLNIFNKFIHFFQRDKLNFPFDPGNLKNPDELAALQAWTFGFHEALFLRPEIWYPEHSADNFTEQKEDLDASLAVIMGIIAPDEIEDLFETESAGDDDEQLHILAKLYSLLPQAVDTIQCYAFELDQQRRKRYVNRSAEQQETKRPPKIGRNDPCPCGSGKKYKKCCLQGKIIPIH